MSRSLLGACLVLMGAGLIAACASKSTTSDGLAVAGSTSAQAELRRLEGEWELRSDVARAELRGELEDYVRKYQEDPSVQRARLMLAQIALTERRLASAEEILEPLVKGPPGPTRDEAQIILAAIDNRRGEHEKALARLEPLEGKLLSRAARDQYARERTNAAIAARRWRLAVDAMIAWLAEAGTTAQPVKDWIESAVVHVPTRALSRVLADWDRTAKGRDQSANDWVYRLVVEHLADEALRARDPLLARDLLKTAPPWLRAGKNGDELAVLAAQAEQAARVVGRGVGVVVGGQTDEQKRRSVRVALGLVRGLKLGLAEDSSDGIQLLSAEDRGSMASALGILSGLGASIMIAGVDESGATEALAFAESRKVPVVVMHEPKVVLPSSYGFVFGVGADAQKAALNITEAEAGKWVFIGEGRIPCSSPGYRPGVVTFPLAEWREAGVRSILVLGDGACCQRVSKQIALLSWSPEVVWGLECAHSKAVGKPGPRRLATAQFPDVHDLPASDEIGDEERAVMDGNAPPPVRARDWYFSLGYDVAQLVRAAMLSLPETQVTDEAEVRRRHQKARDGLAQARGELLTSQARGFSAQGRIKREIQLRASEEGAL